MKKIIIFSLFSAINLNPSQQGLPEPSAPPASLDSNMGVFYTQSNTKSPTPSAPPDYLDPSFVEINLNSDLENFKKILADYKRLVKQEGSRLNFTDFQYLKNISKNNGPDAIYLAAKFFYENLDLADKKYGLRNSFIEFIKELEALFKSKFDFIDKNDSIFRENEKKNKYETLKKPYFNSLSKLKNSAKDSISKIFKSRIFLNFFEKNRRPDI